MHRGAARLVVLLGCGLLCSGVRIGTVNGPYTTGGVRRIEVDGGPNNKMVTAALQGIPKCSGIVARLALTALDVTAGVTHEISLSYHTYGNAMCAEISSYQGDRGSQRVIEQEFFECGDPIVDPHSQTVVFGIEWQPMYSSFSLNGAEVARFVPRNNTKARPRYYTFHNLMVVIHHTANETRDGPSTSVCQTTTTLLKEITVTPLTTKFDPVNRITYNFEGFPNVWETWSGRFLWERLNTYHGQSAEELLLQSNVNLTPAGIAIGSMLIDPFFGGNPVYSTAINGLFQDFTSTTFSHPEPWIPDTDTSSVVNWWYDPFKVAGQGTLDFNIQGSGSSGRSISLSQAFAEPLPNVAPSEFCLYMAVATTWSRAIEVSLFATGNSSVASKAEYFGVWRPQLQASTAHSTYNICFRSPGGGGELLTLEVLLGAVDGVFLVEHTISFASINVYRVVPKQYPDNWAGSRELLEDTSFSNPSSWIASFPVGAAIPTFTTGNGFSLDVLADTTHPQNLSLQYTNKLALVEGSSYRIALTGSSSGAGRFIQMLCVNADGEPVFGGTRIIRLTNTDQTYEYAFKADQTAVAVGSADGTATLWVLMGSVEFGGTDDDPTFSELHLLQWNADEPSLDPLPAESALGPRTPRFTTPSPPVPVRTPEPPPSTPQPTSGPTPEPIPGRFVNATDIPSVHAVLYQSEYWQLNFEDTAVEDIDVAVFRSNLSTTMIDVCTGMGFKDCDLSPSNIEVVEICYSNMVPAGFNDTSVPYKDVRACRGLGDTITYAYAATRNANATGVNSYMIFTFIGLPLAQTVDDRFELRVIEALNANIAVGRIGIRPSALGAKLAPLPAPPPPPPEQPRGDYGLTNYMWLALIGVAALVGLALGFWMWYEHKLHKRMRDEATKALFKEDLMSPDVYPTILNTEGQLQLEQLGMLKQQFDLIDADGGGTLDKKEIRDVLQLMKLNVTEEEFETFFSSIDEDGNEEIEFTEFAVGFIPFLIGHVKSTGDEEAEADRIFAALSGSNNISSIFEERVIAAEESKLIESTTPFLERQATKVVKELSRKRQQSRGQQSSVPDAPSMGEVQVGDEVVVTTDEERYETAQGYIAEYHNEDELPPNHDEVSSHAGVVLQVEYTEDNQVFSILVDLPSKGAAYSFHPDALDFKYNNSIAQWVSRKHRLKSKRLEIYMICRAVVAGFISSALSAGAETLAEEFLTEDTPDRKSLSPNTGKTPPYWVVLILATTIFSLLEILWLYFDALKTTMKTGELFGLVLYPQDEERRFFTSALARCCLELGNPVAEMWSIDPIAGKSEYAKAMAELAYKAKSGVPSFLLRMTFKRLLTRIGAKAAQAYLTCPVVMIANGLVARLVLDHSRIVSLAPRLVTRMLEHVGDHTSEVPPWVLGSAWVSVSHFEKLSVQILRAIGCVVAARGEWHPSLEFLYKQTRKKLGISRTKGTRKMGETIDENAPLNAEEEDEREMDELRLRQLMKTDCCVTHDMACVDKLVYALRLDANADIARAEQAVESDSDEGDDYDVVVSDSTSRSEMPAHIALNEYEKRLVLKFMVLAVLVSGKPNSACKKVVARVFAAAGGDITTRPQKTIDALFQLFYSGNLQAVVENFELVFRSHRTMKGDTRGMCRSSSRPHIDGAA
ncbi:Calmodulin-alpha [Diplonema papillatum]|nr:Calmodulin-alpha [Diplonema papillatum]